MTNRILAYVILGWVGFVASSGQPIWINALLAFNLAYVAWNIFFLRNGRESFGGRSRPTQQGEDQVKIFRSNAFLLVIAILLFDTSVWILATLGNVGSIQHAIMYSSESLGSKESSLRFSFSSCA